MDSFKNQIIQSISVLCLSFSLVSSSVEAKLSLPKGPCESEVRELIKEDSTYKKLYKTLNPYIPELTTLLSNTNDDASYQQLLNFCNSIANLLPTGRIVVVDPDGLVAVDTSMGSLNNFGAFQAGASPAAFAFAINVNHNSRISILAAQQSICGIGVETKYSNSIGINQNYVAIRLGNVAGKLNNNPKTYLNNAGTVRISVNEGAVN